MATTNLNGTDGRVSYQAVAGVDFSTGQTPVFVSGVADNLGAGKILGIDVSLGLSKEPGEVSGLRVDRAPNMPSGYKADGSADYGDGVLNNTTAFARDSYLRREYAGVSYFQPQKPVSKKLVEFTS